MNLAVLGPTGQVGSAVLGAARRRDDVHATAVGRDVVDLDDLDGIRAAVGELDADVIVNCAGYTAVDGAESEPAAAFRRNAYAVDEIARGAVDAGARLVHLSTDYVFDGEAGRPYRPDDAPAPLSVYGASKLTGEALARRAHRDVVIVRTSSVFGVAAVARGGGNFVETMLRLSRERDRIDVVVDIVMAPTYAADLADALLDLTAAAPGTYHVTNAGQTTWYDFARAILAEAGRETTVDPVGADDYGSAARRPRHSVLATENSEAVTGSLPPWRDALSRYLAERASEVDGLDDEQTGG